MRAHPLVVTGSALAAGLSLHAVVNLRHLRRPDAAAPAVTERVSVLVPARNEQAHVGRTVGDLLAQQGVPDLEVLVLDDGSTDGTAAILGGFDDPRLTVHTGADEPPPPGWLGKSWACARLAERATGTVLVFADADVAFAPHAVRAAVDALRAGGFALVSPFPREVADDWLSRLVQPLLAWSVAATLPLRLAEGSTHPALSAANGQFLVVDAAAYRRAGGHAAVAGDVLEDIGLMRAVKASGAHASTLDGSRLATCRMYATPTELVDGYAKSAWSAFGGPGGSVAVTALLGLAALVPPLAAVGGRRPGTRVVGALGYAAAVAGRAAVAARVGGRVWPDSATHPASVLAFAALNAVSWRRRLRGAATWKGRPLP